MTYMTETRRVTENEKLTNQIVELMDRRMELTRKLHRYIEGTFTGIQVMTSIAYALGIFMIVASVLYYFLTEQRLEVLGFSALGSAELVAIFLYQPMQRVQNALGDFSQHTVVLHAWNTQVALKILHMNIEDKKSVDEVCEYIQKVTREFSRTIEELTEQHQGGATPG